MATTSTRPTMKSSWATDTLLALLRWAQASMVVVGALIVLAAAGGFDALAPSGGGHPADHVALDIMPVKPGGPAAQYAAYVPTTVFSIAAQRLVTITIRNFDLDPAPLPLGSPYATVEGTVGDVAYADGKVYRALDLNSVAHTFTVPELHLNVPIPGTSTSRNHYVTVQFRLRISKAGVYSWRCLAPCGDGPNGQDGPMADEGYMRGTLFVGA